MFQRTSGRHRDWRFLALFLGTLIAAAAISACDTDDGPIRITATPQTPVPTVPPTPTSDPLIAAAARVPPGAVGPLDYPEGINPLTGLPFDDPDAILRPPLAAKISNAPDFVRPQAGIAQADLVFEHYVEGSLTRFTAFFWTHNPPRVGSIRSARLIDLELPAMYDALFAYSGANAVIQQRITEQSFGPRAFEGVSTGVPLYFRDTGIEVPHNMFIVPAEVWARAERNGVNAAPDVRGMLFDATPPASDEQAAMLTVNYGPDVVEWHYDEEQGIYRRIVDGEPHRDANTGAQVTAANVVVLYVTHSDDTDVVAGEWNGEPYYHTAIELWGQGIAVLCRDGQRIQGVWMRPGADDVLTFWADDSLTEMLALKPGNTWFQIVPADFTRAWVE